MPFVIDDNRHYPVTIPDATQLAAGVMSAADKTRLDHLASLAPFTVDISAIDGSDIDILFPGGFVFVGPYCVSLTGYFAAVDAPMVMTIVPRPGDPAPPTQATNGFRINLQAPVTQPARIVVWAHQ